MDCNASPRNRDYWNVNEALSLFSARSSRWQIFYKIVFLKISKNSQGNKHLRWSHFLIKLQACEFFKNCFKNALFGEYPRTAASF